MDRRFMRFPMKNKPHTTLDQAVFSYLMSHSLTAPSGRKKMGNFLDPNVAHY